MRRLSYASLAALGLLCRLALPAYAAAESDGFKTGEAFQRALDDRVSVVWENVTLREALRRLSDQLQVAILLDRRIDPSQPVKLSVNSQPFLEIVGRVAQRADASLSVVGHVVYVGPDPAAAVARTLVALRKQELNELPADRRAALRRTTTLTWSDLDRPDEILGRIAGRYDLSIQSAQRVRLDMWAGATLPSVGASEQLTLALLQWDLTFRWQQRGRAVELVPLPDEVIIQRRYPISGNGAVALAQRWQRAVEGIQAKPAGSGVIVRGTLEQHEQLQRLRSGTVQRAGPRHPGSERGEKRYRLRVKNKPIKVILDLISERSGYRFIYNAKALSAAGVSLQRRVSLETERATFEELLQQLLSSTKVTYQIQGRNVVLRVGP